MGCDIHPYIEYQDNGTWRLAAVPTINRNYYLFACLAGVRDYDDIGAVVEPKGFPIDADWSVRDKFTLYITDDEDLIQYCTGYCSKDDAERWGNNYADAERKTVYHPDWHTPSWLTSDELDLVINKYLHAVKYLNAVWYSNIPGVQAIYSYMKTMEANGKPARLVFWFDN